MKIKRRIKGNSYHCSSADQTKWQNSRTKNFKHVLPATWVSDKFFSHDAHCHHFQQWNKQSKWKNIDELFPCPLMHQITPLYWIFSLKSPGIYFFSHAHLVFFFSLSASSFLELFNPFNLTLPREKVVIFSRMQSWNVTLVLYLT